MSSECQLQPPGNEVAENEAELDAPVDPDDPMDEEWPLPTDDPIVPNMDMDSDDEVLEEYNAFPGTPHVLGGPSEVQAEEPGGSEAMVVEDVPEPSTPGPSQPAPRLTRTPGRAGMIWSSKWHL